MSLATGGSFTVDRDNEFRCDLCKRRCTRHPVKGTEFGHLIGCPNRPDELRHLGGSSGSTYYKPDTDTDEGGASV